MLANSMNRHRLVVCLRQAIVEDREEAEKMQQRSGTDSKERFEARADRERIPYLDMSRRRRPAR